MAEAGEVAGVTRRNRRLQLAAGTEITAAKKIRYRNHGRAHGAVLVGALSPRQVVVNPELKAHSGLSYRGAAEQLVDCFQQLAGLERLGQADAVTEGGNLVGIGTSGKIQ